VKVVILLTIILAMSISSWQLSLLGNGCCVSAHSMRTIHSRNTKIVEISRHNIWKSFEMSWSALDTSSRLIWSSSSKFTPKSTKLNPLEAGFGSPPLLASDNSVRGGYFGEVAESVSLVGAGKTAIDSRNRSSKLAANVVSFSNLPVMIAKAVTNPSNVKGIGPASSHFGKDARYENDLNRRMPAGSTDDGRSKTSFRDMARSAYVAVLRMYINPWSIKCLPGTS
jgi:hypothetical protein